MKSLARDAVYSLRARRALRKWRATGCPVPPPPAYKQHVVRKCAQEHLLDVFIETGTLRGDMVYAVRHQFWQIISIELSEHFAAKAQSRLRRFPHVRVIHGDSAEVLPGIVSQLNQPALFWLDAHFSGDGTARGRADTPILDELSAILPAWIDGSMVLIDDARRFVGGNSYPTIETLGDFVRTIRASYKVAVENDIICLS